MKRLRFGVIGMSPGNGHPYSWSAIFNGYNPGAMAQCPFPVIPEYLARQQFPRDAITDAAVTHVWAQEPERAAHIALAAHIAHVVQRPEDMIGQIDGILLARDDAENHFDFAAPFLDAGLPIYIDKPLAFSAAAAERLYARQRRPGQIFTCSALAYAPEFQMSPTRRRDLGELRHVEGSTIKDWDHYAIHVIDPLVNLLDPQDEVVQTRAYRDGVEHNLEIRWRSGLTGLVRARQGTQGDIRLTVHGSKATREMIFRDTFSAFRAALRQFTDIVLGRCPPQGEARVLKVIRLIEAGRSLGAAGTPGA